MVDRRSSGVIEWFFPGHGPDLDLYHKNAIDGPFEEIFFLSSQRAESS